MTPCRVSIRTRLGSINRSWVRRDRASFSYHSIILHQRPQNVKNKGRLGTYRLSGPELLQC